MGKPFCPPKGILHEKELLVSKVEFIKGRHYGDHVQSTENIFVTCLGKEIYQFQIKDQEESGEIKEYEPIVITPQTDLSSIDESVLEEFDMQMYYEAESGTPEGATAKHSKVRQHINDAYAGD